MVQASIMIMDVHGNMSPMTTFTPISLFILMCILMSTFLTYLWRQGTSIQFFDVYEKVIEKARQPLMEVISYLERELAN